MSFQSWMLWPNNVAASVLLLALLAMGFMYAARRPTHELLRSLGHMIGGPLRVASRWLSADEQCTLERQTDRRGSDDEAQHLPGRDARPEHENERNRD